MKSFKRIFKYIWPQWPRIIVVVVTAMMVSVLLAISFLTLIPMLDVMLRGDGGTGYIRVDWFTPDGLNTWGDGRLTILGTEGFIEIRKNTNLGGERPGGNHLFLVNNKETRYFDCSKEPLAYGEQLVHDILNRTETAMTQAHCFLATELALKAQKQARKLK